MMVDVIREPGSLKPMGMTGAREKKGPMGARKYQKQGGHNYGKDQSSYARA